MRSPTPYPPPQWARSRRSNWCWSSWCWSSGNALVSCSRDCAYGVFCEPRVDRLLRSLRAQQRLDRAALVHRAVALRHLLEWQGQVEDLAGVDLPVPDQVDKLGQEAPDRCGTAVQVHMREEV